MAIDRVHWKVGDWVLVIGKGDRQIREIDGEGVTCHIETPYGHEPIIKKLSYDKVAFRGVAESANFKKGDIVYINGTTPVVIQYCQHRPSGVVEYVEWNGDWENAYGEAITAAPLDPNAVKKASLRDRRLAFEALSNKIANLTEGCPNGTNRWLNEMLEAFETEFEEQLKGEQDE